MHEVKRIMRKMNRFITALLVLLSAAGIGLTCMFFQIDVVALFLSDVIGMAYYDDMKKSLGLAILTEKPL